MISMSNCYSQDQKILKIHIEGGYQFRNDKMYFFGIGAKMVKPLKCKLIDYYNIHVSFNYEKYLKSDMLKYHYALTSRVVYEFKYLLIGLSARNINWLNAITDGRFRVDLAPEFGIGYKYLWLTYSRDLLIYQKEKMPILPDNFRLIINIPLFDKKI